MSPEFVRQESGAQETLIVSVVERIKTSKDFLCMGTPIEANRSMQKREHIHIIAAPKEPIFDPNKLNALARLQLMTEKDRKSLKAFIAYDHGDRGMLYTNLDFSAPIGIENVKTETETTITAIDIKALKRRGIKEGNTSKNNTTERKIENLITVHVFPDVLSAKIAFAYLSGIVKGQPYGSIQTKLNPGFTSEPYIDGKLIEFLKNNQGMDTIEAVRTTEALMQDK